LKLNILKYRNVEDDIWYYLYIDIETLHLLITNFGMPTQIICIDNLFTFKKINIKLCEAPIEVYCGNNKYFHLPIMEQNY